MTKLAFAKQWAKTAASRFNEATGPQVDGAVLNLSAAEDCLNTVVAGLKATYNTTTKREDVIHRLRAMNRTRLEAEAWLTIGFAALAVSWWVVALWFILKGR